MQIMNTRTMALSLLMTTAAAGQALAFDIGVWDPDTDGVITEAEFDVAWVTQTDYASSYDSDLSGGLDAPEELTGDFSAFDLDDNGVIEGEEIDHLRTVIEEGLAQDF
ncbi:hypothetical protein [Tateyamaria sp. syn59]|uniref:hypothetical protein n=1 Tax=Tateyamaria sp. syn59 TaxID=2576942 RepID=UPI0011BE5618|nr:hypothetical protein [Tateyamaria sp. syn59]